MANHTAKQIADYILYFCKEHGDFVTNLKLQKLLYYTQAWHLALYDEPLFDDAFQAWVHGPVQPGVYGTYKNYGFQTITVENGAKCPNVSDHAKSHVAEVMKVYGGMTGFELEQYTHQELPWVKARAGIPPEESSNNVIEIEDMKSFYKTLKNG